MDAVSGERPLVGLLGPAGTSTGGVRWSARRVCWSARRVCRSARRVCWSTRRVRRSARGVRWSARGVRRSAREVRWGARGVRRSTRGLGTRGGSSAVRVRWNARGGNRGGGRSRRRVGRATVGEADNLGTSNNESIKGVDPDVGPRKSIVHSREAGELARRWLVGASVHHVDLTMEEISLSHRDTN